MTRNRKGEEKRREPRGRRNESPVVMAVLDGVLCTVGTFPQNRDLLHLPWDLSIPLEPVVFVLIGRPSCALITISRI